MLFLLQIVLLFWFLVTVAQVIIDLFHGALLIVSGMFLLVVGYTLKLFARILRLCQRIHRRRRPWGRKRFWFVRP